jgi:hypothetical protein
MQQKHELRKPLSFFSEILTLFPLTTQPASSLKKQTILRKKEKKRKLFHFFVSLNASQGAHFPR